MKRLSSSGRIIFSLLAAVFAAAASAQTVALSDLPALRKQLWEEHVAAVRQSAPFSLVALEPLDSARTGRISIPDSLEPNAAMPYYFGTKGAADSTGLRPVFIYLHGSGPKAAEWYAGLQWAKVFDDAPSAYFIPQIPNEGKYYRWWQKSKQWVYAYLWPLLAATPGLDLNRVYLFGISEGGYGSQRLAAFYADYLAAAGPMAGGEPLINAPAENLKNTPFSLLTGSEDFMFCRNTYTQTTAAVLDSLQRLHPDGYKHRVELIAGRGHGIDYRPTTPWLRQWTRNPWPKHFVWEDFEMDGLHRTGFENLRVDERPSDSLRTRYEMSIHGNTIDITVSNTHYIPLEGEPRWGLTLKWRKDLTPATGGAFTLFLDEHLVDLKKKVTVRVNGRKVFSARLTLTADNMRQSLATFSDPERIFPAAVRVKY